VESYFTEHRFFYKVPKEVVIKGREVYTLTGTFHPSNAHVTVYRSAYEEAGLSVISSTYYYQIVVNRNPQNSVFHLYDNPGLYEYNKAFPDITLNTISIQGNENTNVYSASGANEIPCGTTVVFKPIVRDKIIRCGVIGENSTKITPTKPKTTPSTTTTTPSTTTTTTPFTTSNTTTEPPITTTSVTETVTISTPTETDPPITTTTPTEVTTPSGTITTPFYYYSV
jgi:hypothetical protein